MITCTVYVQRHTVMKFQFNYKSIFLIHHHAELSENESWYH